MKNFKFKSWDIKKKRWAYNDVLLDDEGCEHVLLQGVESDYLSFVNAITCIFSNKHDKSGREIFEYDILELDVTMKGDLKAMAIVYFDTELAMFRIYLSETEKQILDYLSKDLYAWNNKSIVVGNCFEDKSILSNGFLTFLNEHSLNAEK